MAQATPHWVAAPTRNERTLACPVAVVAAALAALAPPRRFGAVRQRRSLAQDHRARRRPDRAWTRVSQHPRSRPSAGTRSRAPRLCRSEVCHRGARLQPRSTTTTTSSSRPAVSAAVVACDAAPPRPRAPQRCITRKATITVMALLTPRAGCLPATLTVRRRWWHHPLSVGIRRRCRPGQKVLAAAPLGSRRAEGWRPQPWRRSSCRCRTTSPGNANYSCVSCGAAHSRRNR